MIALAIFYASMHQPIRLDARAIRRAVSTTSQRVNVAQIRTAPKI